MVYLLDTTFCGVLQSGELDERRHDVVEYIRHEVMCCSGGYLTKSIHHSFQHTIVRGFVEKDTEGGHSRRPRNLEQIGVEGVVGRVQELTVLSGTTTQQHAPQVVLFNKSRLFCRHDDFVAANRLVDLLQHLVVEIFTTVHPNVVTTNSDRY